MATRSSVLAWRIPWTQEPGGLSPRGHKKSDTTEHARTDNGSQRGIHTATCKAPDNLVCIHMTSSNNPGSKGKDVASMQNH